MDIREAIDAVVSGNSLDMDEAAAVMRQIMQGEATPAQAYGEVNFLDHFKEIWTRAFHGFLKTAEKGDYFIFCPELLDSTHYYARKFPSNGELVEESDRYAESILYGKIARECFKEAQARMAAEK